MNCLTRLELLDLRDKMVGKQHHYDKCVLSCEECPLVYDKNNKEISCHGFISFYPEEARDAMLDYLRTHENSYPDLRS